MLKDWAEFTQWSEDDFMSILESLPPELAEVDAKAAARTTPGRPRLWTLQDVWTALQRSGGNIAAAARLLSKSYGATCTPDKISPLIKKYPQLREAIAESEEALLDFCLHAVTTDALNGDARARRFILSHYHPDFMAKKDRH
jgi:hypothetical protein